MKMKSSRRNGKRDDDGTRSCCNAVDNEAMHVVVEVVVNYGHREMPNRPPRLGERERDNKREHEKIVSEAFGV